jgi:CRISPR/Cas system CSM-associated protein Csm3 (group 7 of RAMP superfamily)
MKNMTLKITLKSATTFGRGDGVAGLVDREIEHDTNGFPFLRGRTLKGLLAESAENIVYALDSEEESKWKKAKDALFGKSGRGVDEKGLLIVGDAQLPSSLKEAILKEGWSKEDTLYSLTSIRRQTSMNEHGAPAHASLRSMRVLLPNVILESQLNFDGKLEAIHEQLLAATILDLRRAGTGRNRGRGWIEVELEDDGYTKDLFKEFAEAIQ